MMNLLNSLVFEGKIPAFPIIKKVLFFASFLSLFVLISPSIFKGLGQIAMWALFFIMFIRPLAQVFPKIKLFQTLVVLRKEIGILMGMFGIMHGTGFFLSTGGLVSLQNVFTPAFWILNNTLVWGLLAVIITFFLLITSNFWSIRFLGIWWKRLHRLVYPLFYFVLIHVSLLKPHDAPFLISVGALLLVLLLLSSKKIVLWK